MPLFPHLSPHLFCCSTSFFVSSDFFVVLTCNPARNRKIWLSVNYRKSCIIYQSTCHLSSPVLPYRRASRPQGGQNLRKTRVSCEKQKKVFPLSLFVQLFCCLISSLPPSTSSSSLFLAVLSQRSSSNEVRKK